MTYEEGTSVLPISQLRGGGVGHWERELELGLWAFNADVNPRQKGEGISKLLQGEEACGSQEWWERLRSRGPRSLLSLLSSPVRGDAASAAGGSAERQDEGGYGDLQCQGRERC